MLVGLFELYFLFEQTLLSVHVDAHEALLFKAFKKLLKLALASPDNGGQGFEFSRPDRDLPPCRQFGPPFDALFPFRSWGNKACPPLRTANGDSRKFQ